MNFTKTCKLCGEQFEVEPCKSCQTYCDKCKYSDIRRGKNGKPRMKIGVGYHHKIK